MKVLLNYTAVNRPEISITGAPYASLTCYVISAGLNLYYVLKYTGLTWSWRELALRARAGHPDHGGAGGAANAFWGDVLGRNWLAMRAVMMLAVALFALAALARAIRRGELPGRLGGRK